jgi:hypothetical protein
MKIEGSGSASGSISQRHGSADPDPHQNVMDPQHCLRETLTQYITLNSGGGGVRTLVLSMLFQGVSITAV